jgi:uncharacterized SAM-binding protein YcdF (DUF218 family)
MQSSMARKHSVRNIALIIALVVCAAGVFAFRGVGRWLVREDTLGPADAIVVLSGGMPERADEAARIYVRGYAHEVWITRPESPAADLSEMGIQYTGEESYSRQILIHFDVPGENIRALPSIVVNTEREVEEISSEMRRQGLASVIIVTSPPHTRRVRTLWRKLVGENPRAIVRAAPLDSFDADHWWRDTRDALSVVRELLGLMNAWVGLPVRPHSSQP